MIRPTSLRVAIGLCAWAVLLTPQTLQAQDDSAWIRRTIRATAKSNCAWYGDCERWYRYKAWRERQAYLRRIAREREPTRVYAYERRDDDERYRTGSECRDMRRVVGDQHVSIAGAQAEADKAWAQDVRFHLGERYMDVRHAADVDYECTRSSVGQTLGQVFHRCLIRAKPCRAPKVQQEGERR